MVREADDDAKAALMTGRARLFFQIAAARCGKGSAIMASNPGFGAWGQAIAGDRAPAAAMPDRLLRHSHAARILGESRRPKGTRRAGIVGPAKEKNAVAI